MTKRWQRAWALGAAVIIAAVTVAVWHMWFPGHAFNPAGWQADAEVGSGVRQQMADRLLARGTLIGLTREEAVGLLGEPPATGYFSDWDLVYWLGPERGFIGIDSEWLVLRLGADGRVVEARLVTD